jgi:hypothetical protein
MKYFFTLLLLLNLRFTGQAQMYWQQEVNYNLDVTLNDKRHSLQATAQIEYINNSPQALTFIYFHLWPNAYKNNTTAFAEQQLQNNSREFRFAPDSTRGFIDGLDFKINGQKAKFEFDPEQIDIGKLILNEPLPSGGKITITTPFQVKLPNAFSRLGHVSQSYQVTQWYPKPAVYDHKGWHPMPYLNQGEFYSEFGKFDVSITLPANYTVAATGVLQNPEERVRLDSLANLTAKKTGFPATDDLIPPSSSKTKTLRYVQDNIHDFAWFADKRFNVLKNEVELPHSKRKVITWLMFLNKDGNTWVKSQNDIRDAVHYYSLWLGDYPYAEVTAVDGALSAGSGMEYPMVTVTDPEAIIHEVGHNWFYGILGSNERQHPWLDEGINSYYEFRLGQLTNPNYSQLAPLLNPRRIKNYRLQNIHSTGLNLLLYQMAASRGLAQPIGAPATVYTNANYGSIVYLKTGVLLQYLANYLTQARFDAAMQAYYQRWKYKHPYPEDLQATFEEVTGEKLDWFFRGLINTTQTIDPALTGLTQTGSDFWVTVKHKNSLTAPVPVVTRNAAKKILEVKWTRPGLATQQLLFNRQDVHEVIIDPLYFLPELHRSNNRLALNSIFKAIEPLRLQFLAGIEQADRKQNYYTPALGFNTHDKLMLGAALYNSALLQKKVNYLFMPLYSFGQKDVRGIANINLNILPQKNLQSIILTLNAQRFERFLMLEPAVTFNFPPHRAGVNQQQLKFAFTAVNIQHPVLTPESDLNPVFRNDLKYNIPWVRYRYEKKNALQEFKGEITLDVLPTDTVSDSNYLAGKRVVAGKIALNYERYYTQNKRISVRWFGGNFFGNNAAVPNWFRMGLSTSLDYKKETIFFDRSQRRNNFWAFSRQTDGQDGGFRNYVPLFTNHWLTGLNLTGDIPFLPFSTYLDLGTAYQTEEIYYGTGLSLSLQKNFFQVYFPVAGSNFAQNLPRSLNEFKNNIRFQIQLNALNPFRQLTDVLRK